ncbi:DUF1772 domain-containing protein [Devosia nitrariae]|uniref:anthrone oxygenase family protein n=1 Tax=Devosia nitrariae TaxID=2071872 RepID=UPI003D67B513
MDWIFTLAFAGALGSGLMAGMFYVFSFCIMPALGRLSPEAGIRAMQAINVTVLVPIFLGVFLGMAVLGLAAIVVGGFNIGHPAGWALIAGGLFYVRGHHGPERAAQRRPRQGCARERRGSGHLAAVPFGMDLLESHPRARRVPFAGGVCLCRGRGLTISG